MADVIKWRPDRVGRYLEWLPFCSSRFFIKYNGTFTLFAAPSLHRGRKCRQTGISPRLGTKSINAPTKCSYYYKCSSTKEESVICLLEVRCDCCWELSVCMCVCVTHVCLHVCMCEDLGGQKLDWRTSLLWERKLTKKESYSEATSIETRCCV